MVSDCCCVGFSPKAGFRAQTWWTLVWVFPEVWIRCLIHPPHPQHCVLLWCVYFRRSFYTVLILCLLIYMCMCVVVYVQCESIIEVEDLKPNSVHMALQIPQYFLITTGEVMFSVTGLQFSYSQVQQQYTSPDWLIQHSRCAKMHVLDATWYELNLSDADYQKRKNAGWGLGSVHWFLIG